MFGSVGSGAGLLVLVLVLVMDVSKLSLITKMDTWLVPLCWYALGHCHVLPICVHVTPC
jgi:hypothetical protein